MSQPSIEISHLSKSYSKGQKAVDDLSFAVCPGEVFSLLGPNGAGKTTTIKMILGLVLPTSGSVQLGGFDVLRQRGKALQHAGAVLEGSRNIYWRLSARANLEYFGALRGLSGRSLKQRIDEVLDLLGLLERANEETRNFSRGMQQKVALGVAMLHNPDVLLLDEPTLGLDVQAARTLEDTIQKLVREQGKSVMLTTHQMALAEKLSDRILVIDRGKQIVTGLTREIISRFGGQQATVIRLDCIAGQEALARVAQEFPLTSSAIDGETTLITWFQGGSQSDLLHCLDLLDTLGLPIQSVGRREATLEEVFLQLTSNPGEKHP